MRIPCMCKELYATHANSDNTQLKDTGEINLFLDALIKHITEQEMSRDPRSRLNMQIIEGKWSITVQLTLPVSGDVERQYRITPLEFSDHGRALEALKKAFPSHTLASV